MQFNRYQPGFQPTPLGIVRDVIGSRMTIVTVALLAAYWAYTHYNDIRRIEYSATQGALSVQEPYHGDPGGLAVETPINKEGKVEVYLTHKESGTQRKLYADLLPETNTALDLLVQRARTNRIPPEEQREAFNQASALLQAIYEKR